MEQARLRGARQPAQNNASARFSREHVGQTNRDPSLAGEAECSSQGLGGPSKASAAKATPIPPPRSRRPSQRGCRWGAPRRLQGSSTSGSGPGSRTMQYDSLLSISFWMTRAEISRGYGVIRPPLGKDLADLLRGDGLASTSQYHPEHGLFQRRIRQEVVRRLMAVVSDAFYDLLNGLWTRSGPRGRLDGTRSIACLRSASPAHDRGDRPVRCRQHTRAAERRSSAFTISVCCCIIRKLPPASLSSGHRPSRPPLFWVGHRGRWPARWPGPSR